MNNRALNRAQKVIAWLRSLLPPHVVRRDGNILYFNRELNMREINRLIETTKEKE